MAPPTMGPTSWRRYSSEVTIPKLPLPPRIPQKRSGFSEAFAVSRRPSAVTTSALMTLSRASPYLACKWPQPPPNVSPAMPVAETTPRVVARPKACVSRSNSPSLRPVSARTVRRAGSTRMPFMAERSTMRPPSQTDFPATLCPPPRTARGRSCSRAKRTHAMTSAAPAHRAMRAGRRSIMALGIARVGS
jgi:hypothetical protein